MRNQARKPTNKLTRAEEKKALQEKRQRGQTEELTRTNMSITLLVLLGCTISINTVAKWVINVLGGTTY